jgi:predicted nucleic acid-binding protein
VILYLDTSAFVPLLVAEPTSALCRRLWDDADDVVSSVALRPEAASALWRARHTGRITARQHRTLLAAVADLTEQMHLVVIDDPLSKAAADLASAHGLRGYDAVHAATALTVVAPDGLAASGDTSLLATWQAAPIATCDINAAT